ncbi:MAG: cytidine deaminase [Anaerolineae bacterium]
MSEPRVSGIISADWRALYEAALAARTKAYAPYSHFLVGAAVRCRSGQVYTGCNIENASYGLTVCAERVTAWKAVSAGDTELAQLVIVTEDGSPPCGACRQVLYEFAPDLTLLLADLQGHGLFTNLKELLPNAFSL